ncbi:hypothetical protein BC830DRAFT_1128966 [Chytriomyces sp. MP71]|nr:hypothetical protein BC830DRAFT_1128966 [Chytriomyces sp. MP71]
MGLEVEIKKRVPTRAALEAIEAALSSSGVAQRVSVKRMRDVFVDQGTRIRSFEPKHAVFRVRKVGDEHFEATVKCHATLVDGVSRAEEYEMRLPLETGHKLLANPSPPLAEFNLPFLNEHVIARFGLDPTHGVVPFGGWTTVRTSFQVTAWKDAIRKKHGVDEIPIIELDDTEYSFGPACEIEIETAYPGTVEPLLMDLLQKNGCADGIKPSLKSKFINFLDGAVDRV